MQARKAQPITCDCGYEARDAQDLMDHLVRSKAFSGGKQGVRLDQSIPHADPWHGRRPPAEEQHTDAPGDEDYDEEDDSGSYPPFQLPPMYRFAYGLAIVLGILMIGLVVSVSAFFFAPFVLDPLVSVGPLKPYARLMSFLWEWGLVILPLLALAVATVALRPLRRAAKPLAVKVLAWAGVAFWATLAATSFLALVFWSTLRALDYLEMAIPGWLAWLR